MGFFQAMSIPIRYQNVRGLRTKLNKFSLNIINSEAQMYAFTVKNVHPKHGQTQISIQLSFSRTISNLTVGIEIMIKQNLHKMVDVGSFIGKN